MESTQLSSSRWLVSFSGTSPHGSGQSISTASRLATSSISEDSEAASSVHVSVSVMQELEATLCRCTSSEYSAVVTGSGEVGTPMWSGGLQGEGGDCNG